MTTSNCGTDELSFNLDMQERFQWLKQNEKTRYMCPDYTNPLQYTSSTDGDWQERLQGILDKRKKVLVWLYECGNELGIPSRVMSTAVYIFDRYLSTFVTAYVKRELAFLEHHEHLIAIASLLIAVKSLFVYRHDIKTVVESFGCFTKQLVKDKVEITILMALDWNIVYSPPIAIIEDLLSVLPRPCEYDEGHEEAFVRFHISVLHQASRLTRQAEWMGDFIIKYPPSTIALAALSISLDQPDVTGIPIFILVPPCRWCEIEINKKGIYVSFDDEDVVLCRKDMHRFFPTKAINKDTAERVTGTNSPTTVAEVHKRRRTTKKRNSFAAKSA